VAIAVHVDIVVVVVVRHIGDFRRKIVLKKKNKRKEIKFS